MAENNYKWYAIKVISGKETSVKDYIEAMKQKPDSEIGDWVSQVLIPIEKVVTQGAGKKRVVKERNKLPGYILVEADMTENSHYSKLRDISNVLGFVTEGRDLSKLSPIPQSQINALIGDVEQMSDEALLLNETYLVGEKIKVVEGPFAGFNGEVKEVLSDKKKLKVIVTIFDRETPLELSYNQVARE